MVELFNYTDFKRGKTEKRPEVIEEKYTFKDLEEIKIRKGKSEDFSLIYGQEKKIEGKKILEAAREQSKRIIEEARTRMSELEKEAYEKGEKKAFEAGKQKIGPLFEMFQQKINELIELKKDIFQNAEKEILELSVSLAQRIIHHEIRIHKDVILGVIRSAAKKILGREQIVIRINPEDMEYVLQNKPEFKEEFKNIQQVSFKEDATISKGGCIIDTEYGSISADLEEEFEEFSKDLSKKLGASMEEKKTENNP